MKSFLINFFFQQNVYVHETSSFRWPKAHPRLFYDGNFLMETSRFVCGEISRLIKLLRAVARNAHLREMDVKKPPRKHVSHSYECFLCFHTSVAHPVASPRYPFAASSRAQTLSHPFSLSNSHSAFFLDGCFCLIRVIYKQKAIKKRRGNGDVARAHAASERNLLTMQINGRNIRDSTRAK